MLEAAKVEELDRVARVLDPIRLLSQLECLQQALWRHATQLLTQESQSPAHAALHFDVQQCAAGALPNEGITSGIPVLSKRKRYERQNRPRPHDWRTRKDPFAGLWEQITTWLTDHPERTGVSIFQELRHLYPRCFSNTQVRTLQRGLQKVRARLLVTFDDQWTQEAINGHGPALVLRAIATAGAF